MTAQTEWIDAMSDEKATDEDAKGEDAKAEEPKAEEPTGSDKGEGTFDAAYVAKLRKEAAKYRTDAKAAQEKAEKFDAAEAAGKTELQKANDAAADAAKRLEDVQNELLRSQVAIDKKLPAALADRLRGANKEEMEADADALLADLAKQFVPKSGTKSEDTGAGVKGKPTDFEAMSPKELVKMVRDRDM
jgi:hypothetical protein